MKNIIKNYEKILKKFISGKYNSKEELYIAILTSSDGNIGKFIINAGLIKSTKDAKEILITLFNINSRKFNENEIIKICSIKLKQLISIFIDDMKYNQELKNKINQLFKDDSNQIIEKETNDSISSVFKDKGNKKNEKE